MQNTAIDLEWIRPFLNSMLYWGFIITAGYAVFRIASRYTAPSDDSEPSHTMDDDSNSSK